MAHIHTNPGNHDATASGFIVRTDTADPKLLLHMHKKLGVFLQPGGHVELNETPWQAVLHEIVEETGYGLEQLRVLQPAIRIKKLTGVVLHPQPIVINTHNFYEDGSHKHSDTSFAFVANGAPVGMPAEGESTNFLWVNNDELRAIEAGKVVESVRQIGEFLLTEVLADWEPIQLDQFEA